MTERFTNFKPFRVMIERYHYLSHEPGWKTLDFYENLYGNIGLFIPLPIIMLSLFRMKNKWLVMFLCIMISIGIETVQYIFEIGVADIDDVILNSTGAVIGIFIYSGWMKIWKSIMSCDTGEK